MKTSRRLFLKAAVCATTAPGPTGPGFGVRVDPAFVKKAKAVSAR